MLYPRLSTKLKMCLWNGGEYITEGWGPLAAQRRGCWSGAGVRVRWAQQWLNHRPPTPTPGQPHRSKNICPKEDVLRIFSGCERARRQEALRVQQGMWTQGSFCGGIHWETGVRAAERPDRCLSSISLRQELSTPWMGTETGEVIPTCTRGGGPVWDKGFSAADGPLYSQAPDF